MQLSKLNHVKTIYFCYFAAMAGFMPFLVLYYAQLGLNGQQIGLLAGIPPVVTLVAAPLWGGLADATHQHRRLLFAAIVAALVCVGFFLLAGNLTQLLVVVTLYALATAPIMPLIDNSVLHLLGTQRQRYGRLRLWGALGWGVVGTLGGFLVDRYGLNFSFYTFFVFMVGLLIAATSFPVSSASIGRHFWQGARSLFSDWQWTVLLIAIFSSSVVSSITNNYLFLYMEGLGASKSLMGLSLTAGTLSELPVFFFADRLLQRWGPRRLLMVALAAQVVRAFGYALMPAPWVVLPINLLHGLTFSAMWSAGVAYANELAAPKGLMTTAQGVLGGATMGSGGLARRAARWHPLRPAWAGGAFFVLLVASAGLIFFIIAGRNVSAPHWSSERVGQ